MPSRYKIIKTEKEFRKLIKYCKQTGYAAFDFETSGYPFHHPMFYPTILGVSFQPGSSWIIPLAHFDSPFKSNNQWKRLLIEFAREVLEDINITKVTHGGKFELKVLKVYGLEVHGRLFDSMLAKYLLDEERPMGLKPLVDRFIPEFAGYEEDYDGSKLPWDQKPLEGLSKYCGLDTDLTFRLMMFFENRLIKTGLYKLFRNMLMMSTRVLADSEFMGMPVDVEYLEELDKKYQALIAESDSKLRSNKKIKRFEKWLKKDRVKNLIISLEEEIEDLWEEHRALKKKYKEEKDEKEKRKLLIAMGRKEKAVEDRYSKIDRYIAGDFSTKKELKTQEPLNFGSPKQMGDLFFNSPHGFNFDVVRYTVDKKTKQESNNPSTDETVLLELKDKDKSGFIEELLNYRGLTKLYSTYIKGIKEKLSVNNRIHGRFLLEGTVTGRLCISQDSVLYLKGSKCKIGDLIPSQIGVREIPKKEQPKVLTHTGEYKNITHAINKGEEEMFRVELENGKIIECTKNHVFYTNKGWLDLKDITDEKIIFWEDD